ncbi:hypothetical protein [Sphingomonas sp. S2-65]|uniref:hypothetical protein n=1 Tax=Sphingomonas sp. S2-65 TaxID=2903960 RepID=UPI001F389A60|nr:hypothetical protein [Sphingomonas sp. S2-65]UYY59419.1 hypothetical protein LZ586_04860 [Sphingomonas sp. S2-65]
MIAMAAAIDAAIALPNIYRSPVSTLTLAEDLPSVTRGRQLSGGVGNTLDGRKWAVNRRSASAVLLAFDRCRQRHLRDY